MIQRYRVFENIQSQLHLLYENSDQLTIQTSVKGPNEEIEDYKKWLLSSLLSLFSLRQKSDFDLDASVLEDFFKKFYSQEKIPSAKLIKNEEL